MERNIIKIDEVGLRDDLKGLIIGVSASTISNLNMRHHKDS